MNYESLEDAVVALLAADSSYIIPKKIQCIPLPEDMEVPKPTTSGIITAYYNESKYNDPNATGFGNQDERIAIELGITSNKLRGDYGIYRMLKEVKRILHGQRILSSQHLRLIKQGYSNRQDGSWNYHMIFETTAPSVMYHNYDNDPLLTDLKFNESIQKPGT